MTETHGCGMLGSRPPASAPTPIQDPARQRLTRLGLALLATGAVALAVSATRVTLAKTGGEPAVPLDDTFIHFQYAKRFAQLAPFSYSPGAAPAPGATSLLWPLFLAPFWKLGFRDVSLVWPAWFFGWLALFGVAVETWRLGRKLLPEGVAFVAGAGALCFGGLVWGAGSGMEIVPFAWWLVVTARVSAEWHDRREQPATPRELAVLLLLGGLAPCVRPEGVLLSAIAAGALLVAPRGRGRAFAALPLLGMALPGFVNFAFTGTAQSTTAAVKWLPSSPYYRGSVLLGAVMGNVRLLFERLLDGQAWSAVFVPSGGRLLAWLALPALAVLSVLRREYFRGTIVLLLALGMLIPATYDSFLWNRLRYLWPFAPGWFLALAALAQLLARALARLEPRLERAGLVITGIIVGSFAAQLSWTLEDLAVSSDGIRRQQVALGRWARDNLPPSAKIGVNDTGAVAYFSDRHVFDVVGLTTPKEARYWVAGAGSRFEHYERLDKAELPTHFIVYPGWMAMPEVLGEMLTQRSVTGATILGGVTKVAYVARFDLLGSAGQPAATKSSIIDSLDVADLDSERDHDYALLDARQRFNRVFSDGSLTRADGGRGQRARESFRLKVEGGGRLIARLASEESIEIEIRVGGTALDAIELSGASPWEEVTLELPEQLPSGPASIELLAKKARFSALHYWSLAPATP